MRETALVVEVSNAEDLVRGWREQHDPVASQGMPGHITVLFPFVVPENFDTATVDALDAALADVNAFDYLLTAVDEFPGAVWLRPEPDQRFRALTRCLWEAFPDYPPYGGRFPDSQPHLTLAIVGDPTRQRDLVAQIRDDLDPRMPIRCRAEAVSVFMTDRQGVWRREHRILLRTADSRRAAPRT